MQRSPMRRLPCPRSEIPGDRSANLDPVDLRDTCPLRASMMFTTLAGPGSASDGISIFWPFAFFSTSRCLAWRGGSSAPKCDARSLDFCYAVARVFWAVPGNS